MAELLVDLRRCDKSIEHWLDVVLYEAGTKKHELWYWYGHRDIVLRCIREERRFV